MEVDDIDRQVVNALLENGRASPRDVSTATGVAVPTVEKRIDSLERRGVVDGYEPRIDYGALGYDVTAVLRVRTENGADEAIERIADREELVTVYEVTGDDDAVAVGKFRDVGAMHRRVGELVDTAGVRDVRTAVALDAVAEHSQFPVALEGDGV